MIQDRGHPIHAILAPWPSTAAATPADQTLSPISRVNFCPGEKMDGEGTVTRLCRGCVSHCSEVAQRPLQHPPPPLPWGCGETDRHNEGRLAARKRRRGRLSPWSPLIRRDVKSLNQLIPTTIVKRWSLLCEEVKNNKAELGGAGSSRNCNDIPSLRFGFLRSF